MDKKFKVDSWRCNLGFKLMIRLLFVIRIFREKDSLFFTHIYLSVCVCVYACMHDCKYGCMYRVTK